MRQIVLDFDAITGVGLNGFFAVMLEQPIVQSDRIIPAGIPQTVPIVNGSGTIALIPSQPHGIFYSAFLLVDGQRRWTGRFQLGGGTNPARMSDLIAQTPITPDNWDASIEAIIDRLLADPDFAAIVSGSGSGGTAGVTSINGRSGAVTIEDGDIPASIARDSEVTSAIAAHANAADPHPQYAIDSDLIAGLAAKSDILHNHSPATGSAAGFLSAADKTKLDGIAAGATANQPDSFLLNRANHAGTQAIDTVDGLTTALNSKEDAGTAAAQIAAHAASGHIPPSGIGNEQIADNAGIDWDKISKTGASPADVGAAPANHTHPISSNDLPDLSSLYQPASNILSAIVNGLANAPTGAVPTRQSNGSIAYAVPAGGGGGGGVTGVVFVGQISDPWNQRQELAPNTWTTIRLNPIFDPQNRWNSTNFHYLIPASGSYMAISRIRLEDNLASTTFGQGVHSANDDAAWILWQPTAQNNGARRNSSLNTRLANFNQNDPVRLYANLNTVASPIIFAELYIVRIS